MQLVPILLKKPIRALDDLTDSFESHGRVFVANHWVTDEHFEGELRVRTRRRLAPVDTRNGELRWTVDGVTTRLEEVMQGEVGKGWSYVPDWQVSESGRLLWCITGQFPMVTKSSWWSSGGLFEVELASKRVTQIHMPDVTHDAILKGLHALGEDELILLSTRALRRFIRKDGVWVEGKAMKIAHGDRLSVGRVGDRTIALIAKNDAKAGARSALVVTIERDKFTLLGELLHPIVEVSVQDGEARVCLDSGWHRVELGETASVRDESRGVRAKGAVRAEAPVAASLRFGARSFAPAMPDAVQSRIGDVGRPMPTRALGGGLFAGVKRIGGEHSRLVVMRDAEVLADVDVDSEGGKIIRFDVTEGGLRWFMLTSQNKIFERVLGEDAWRLVDVDVAGHFGPSEIAALDSDHIAIKASSVLELWRRAGDRWEAFARTKVPVDARVFWFHERSCLIVAGMKTIRAYVRVGDKLRLWCEAPHPTPPRTMLPHVDVGLDGRLRLDDWEMSFEP